MCGDYELELVWDLKCERCGKKPAVNLKDPYTGEKELGYASLCEKCGIEVYSEEIVSDWAGTELYLKKYPDEIGNWR